MCRRHYGRAAHRGTLDPGFCLRPLSRGLRRTNGPGMYIGAWRSSGMVSGQNGSTNSTHSPADPKLDAGAEVTCYEWRLRHAPTGPCPAFWLVPASGS